MHMNVIKNNDKAKALAEAPTYMLTHGYKNPFNWAPFILMGE